MRRTYYEVTLPINPGWMLAGSVDIRHKDNAVLGTVGTDLANPMRWKEPPHVILANLGYTPSQPGGVATIEEVRRFVKKVGPVAKFSQGPEAGNQFEINVELFGYMQDSLRNAWLLKDARRLWLQRGFENLDNFPVSWATGGIELRPADCWTYIRLLLMRDLIEKRARVCANQSCPAPYFIARRNNQKFCEWKCANVVAQRDFRKRRK